jgi:RNA polymerase sigma-70 factor (ECF subfamily)
MRQPDPRDTRPSLLLRIRDANDSDSWADFATVYGPVIRGYCRRRGLQEADADDVSQEVLAQVARSIESFDYEPGRGRFRDWLGAVTRNKIVRFLEVKRRGGPAAGWEMATVQPSCLGEDPEWLAEFQKMIAKKVEDRYQTMTEVITDLDHCVRAQEQMVKTVRSIGTSTDTFDLDLKTLLKDVSLEPK